MWLHNPLIRCCRAFRTIGFSEWRGKIFGNQTVACENLWKPDGLSGCRGAGPLPPGKYSPMTILYSSNQLVALQAARTVKWRLCRIARMRLCRRNKIDRSSNEYLTSGNVWVGCLHQVDATGDWGWRWGSYVEGVYSSYWFVPSMMLLTLAFSPYCWNCWNCISDKRISEMYIKPRISS